MGAATQFFEMGRLDKAAAHAELAVNHDAAAAHELMARIALARGDLESAEDEARLAMSLEDRRAGPRLVLTDVLFAGGRPIEAIEVLETAYDEGIHDETLRTKLAFVYMAAGEIDRATGILSGLEESQQPETLVLFGRIAGLKQQFGEARSWFEKALQADPSNAEAMVNLGVLAAVEGRMDDARRLLEKGVARDPRSFEGWNALGMIKARGGDPDGAVDAWTRALEINPQSTDLLFNLGLAHAEAGRFARAAEYMEAFAEVADGEARERALSLAEQYRKRVRGFGLGIS
jgi:Tfp pilus assembly protein PilF